MMMMMCYISGINSGVARRQRWDGEVGVNGCNSKADTEGGRRIAVDMEGLPCNFSKSAWLQELLFPHSYSFASSLLRHHFLFFHRH
jgi:hypothetical protein